MAPGIRNRNLAKGSAARTITSSFWDLLVQPTDATEHLAAGTLNTQIVGGSPATFAAFYTKNCQSIFVTPAFSGLTALTLRITGLNQFGDPIAENLVFAAATATQTAFCYTRVLTCTIVAMTGTPAAGDTVSIGYSLVNPRIPMMAQLKAAGSIKAVSNSNQVTAGSQPTVKSTTINPAADIGGNSNVPALPTGASVYNILLTGTLVIATNGLAHLHVTLDPNDPLL